ncbi:MAG TPA: hypothetical protein PLB52_02140 [Candidatus Moranbacteria bacterium]|nr:hypothetical protein [Candidatus Moranbacteria bacterium]
MKKIILVGIATFVAGAIISQFAGMAIRSLSWRMAPDSPPATVGCQTLVNENYVLTKKIRELQDQNDLLNNALSKQQEKRDFK